MLKYILITIISCFIFLSNLPQSFSQRAEFLGNHVNLFLDYISEESHPDFLKVKMDGTIVLSSTNELSIDSLLSIIDGPELNSFLLKRESPSLVFENFTYINYQQLYSGIEVLGGGFTLMVNESASDRIERFIPYIYNEIDVETIPIVDSSKLGEILDCQEIGTAELVISDLNASDYKLLWNVVYMDTTQMIALVDAANGSNQESFEKGYGLEGTTQTYGVQQLNDFTNDNIEYKLKTPNESIILYEGLNPTFPYSNNLHEWDHDLVPSTTEDNWDIDANFYSRSTFYAVGAVVNMMENKFEDEDLEFGVVHVTSGGIGAFFITLEITFPKYIYNLVDAVIFHTLYLM